MKRNRILLLLLVFFTGINGYAQIDAISDKAYILDTLKTHSFSTNVNILFSIVDKESNAYAEWKVANAIRFSYLFNKSDIEFSFRQLFDRKDDGTFLTNHYILLSSGIHKYKPINKNTTKVRKFYPEPLLIFQNNNDRGLHWRYQVGALFHPWKIIHPVFKVNFGLGGVYDWSAWEVNDMNAINAASPELREKILFINSHIPLKKDMYHLYSEFRPMIFLNLNYQIRKMITFNLNVSFQQSLSSPYKYNKEIIKKYPDLRKVYPYVLSHFAVSINLAKGFALQYVAELDYENINLSLYKSSWTYFMLFGASWSFSNQK